MAGIIRLKEVEKKVEWLPAGGLLGPVSCERIPQGATYRDGRCHR
jgi:hypothetical protein